MIPESFSEDVVQSLRGPEWLAKRRAEAYRRWEAMPQPSSADEIWRYSRIDDFDLGSYRPAHITEFDRDGVSACSALAVELGDSPVGTVWVHNGRVLEATVQEMWAEAGVRIGEAEGAAPDALGIGTDASPDWFSLLNDAMTPAVVHVEVPPGVFLGGPIKILHWADGEGAAGFPRVVIDVGEGADVQVLEVFLSSPERSLSVPVTECRVCPGGRLNYLAVQRAEKSAWQVGFWRASLDRDAVASFGAVTLGGSYARLRAEVALEGRGADATLSAAYLGGGDQMIDLRTLQDHIAEQTTSSLTFKGAVAQSSESVYSGLIRVGPDADKSSAHQSNVTLKLSPDSLAESVPNLEIETDDVQCSHASAIGPVDEQLRYYLETRGIPAARAEEVIVRGFFHDIFTNLPLRLTGGRLDAAVQQVLQEALS
ncbi:MAG: SufD family Fe-S cluster assembly protein [Actinobacteria bacterium]|nr:SufD family Fe-S cluster assembly protein [Actinomycetota bacterium]MCB9390574.1 SufD family Fe-S cluster assembly protein [Acidimicrobiia bacterium]